MPPFTEKGDIQTTEFISHKKSKVPSNNKTRLANYNTDDICIKQTTTQMISASSKIQHGRYLPQVKYNTDDNYLPQTKYNTDDICLKQTTTKTISASSKNNTDDICLKQNTTKTISASTKLQHRRYLPQTKY